MSTHRTLAEAKKQAARKTEATGVSHKVVVSLPPRKPARYTVVRNPLEV